MPFRLNGVNQRESPLAGHAATEEFSGQPWADVPTFSPKQDGEQAECVRATFKGQSFFFLSFVISRYDDKKLEVLSSEC